MLYFIIITIIIYYYCIFTFNLEDAILCDTYNFNALLLSQTQTIPALGALQVHCAQYLVVNYPRT